MSDWTGCTLIGGTRIAKEVCEVGALITRAQDENDSQPILKAWEYRLLMQVRLGLKACILLYSCDT